jgi:TRAP-type C4-dicarboxylate transport system substrate-binding protein
MPSLQTGLISGGETGTIFYAIAGLPKEAPHLTLSRHAFDTGVYLVNKSWFDGLPKIEQEKLRRSLVSAKIFRQQVRKAEADILAAPEKSGITVHKPDAQQIAEWRNATRENYQQLMQTLGGNSAQIYAKIIAGKKAFAVQQQLQQ